MSPTLKRKQKKREEMENPLHLFIGLLLDLLTLPSRFKLPYPSSVVMILPPKGKFTQFITISSGTRM